MESGASVTITQPDGEIWDTFTLTPTKNQPVWVDRDGEVFATNRVEFLEELGRTMDEAAKEYTTRRK